jgi:hypothetical protein
LAITTHNKDKGSDGQEMNEKVFLGLQSMAAHFNEKNKIHHNLGSLDIYSTQLAFLACPALSGISMLHVGRTSNQNVAKIDFFCVVKSGSLWAI